MQVETGTLTEHDDGQVRMCEHHHQLYTTTQLAQLSQFSQLSLQRKFVASFCKATTRKDSCKQL